jgi:hypothetical protein
MVISVAIALPVLQLANLPYRYCFDVENPSPNLVLQLSETGEALCQQYREHQTCKLTEKWNTMDRQKKVGQYQDGNLTVLVL